MWPDQGDDVVRRARSDCQPKLNAGVYNIFDKTYWNAVNTQSTFTQPAEYYSEPGRTFKISLTQRF